MKSVGDMVLPEALVAVLSMEIDQDRVGRQFEREFLIPTGWFELYSIDWILSDLALAHWAELPSEYFGVAGSGVEVDPRRSVCFGQSDADMPIVLDFSDMTSVVVRAMSWTGESPEWTVIAESAEVFLERLGLIE